MTRPRLLDLFCCQGGAAMGYYRAGFDVVGVDIADQPRYPFEFHQADALEYVAAHGHEFDAIHASPPCQGYSKTEPMKRAIRKQKTYPMLVNKTRAALKASGLPYAIENVMGAPMVNPVVLNGAMFGLKVIRARAFEVWPEIWFTPTPAYQAGMTAARGEYERGQRGLVCVAGNNFEPAVAAAAMGIDWMTRDGLAEAIPPAYTEFIGQHLMAALFAQAAP